MSSSIAEMGQVDSVDILTHSKGILHEQASFSLLELSIFFMRPLAFKPASPDPLQANRSFAWEKTAGSCLCFNSSFYITKLLFF